VTVKDLSAFLLGAVADLQTHRPQRPARAGRASCAPEGSNSSTSRARRAELSSELQQGDDVVGVANVGNRLDRLSQPLVGSTARIHRFETVE
jgi:hypothetical protein